MSVSVVEVTGKGDSGLLSSKQMKDIVTNHTDLLAVSGKHNSDGCLALWASEQLLDGIELDDDDHVEIKTLGDAPFIGGYE